MTIASLGGKKITVGPRMQFNSARGTLGLSPELKPGYEVVTGRPIFIYPWIQLFVYYYPEWRRWVVCERTTGFAIPNKYLVPPPRTMRAAIKHAHKALSLTGRAKGIAAVAYVQRESGITPYAQAKGWC